MYSDSKRIGHFWCLGLSGLDFWVDVGEILGKLAQFRKIFNDVIIELGDILCRIIV